MGVVARRFLLIDAPKLTPGTISRLYTQGAHNSDGTGGVAPGPSHWAGAQPSLRGPLTQARTPLSRTRMSCAPPGDHVRGSDLDPVAHFPSSFYPRAAAPGEVVVETRLDPEIVAVLLRARPRGDRHRWSVAGTAIRSEPKHRRSAAPGRQRKVHAGLHGRPLMAAAESSMPIWVF